MASPFTKEEKQMLLEAKDLKSEKKIWRNYKSL